MRKQFRNIRNKISSEQRHQAAMQAAAILVKTEIFQKSLHIGCYYPMQDEFDSLPIIQAIWKANKKCYLPVLSDEHDLVFAGYEPDAPTTINQYGIPEPDHSNFFPIDHLNLIIAPLVAADNNGNRLGMGAGYYDRTLSCKTCILIGLGYESQISKTALPIDAWDVKLDGLLTEKKLYQF